MANHRMVVRGGTGSSSAVHLPSPLSTAIPPNGIDVAEFTFSPSSAHFPDYLSQLHLVAAAPRTSTPPSVRPPRLAPAKPTIFVFQPTIMSRWYRQGSFGVETELRNDLALNVAIYGCMVSADRTPRHQF